LKRKITIALILALLVIMVMTATLSGCGSSESTSTGQNQTYTVQRGNISEDITAAGNLALSTVEDLTFDLFYQKGTVASVNVAVGDTVTKGDVLASLDTSEWNDQIQALEDALTAAQRDVTTKQRALITAQRQVANAEQAITTAQNQVTAKQLALRQAQLNLETAQYNLAAIADIKDQQDIIDRDTNLLEFIETKLLESVSPSANPLDFQFWTNEKARVTAELAAAQKELRDILAGNSINVSTTVALQVVSLQLALDTAQMNLDNAMQAIDTASTAVTNAQQDLVFAEQDAANAQDNVDAANKAVTDAQQNLAEAKAASPDITAPIDGFVTKINAAGGDQVLSGAVIIEVADPDKFQADILVSEMDITQVAVGGDATVSLDAISGITIPAKVTRISPTATIQSGVVNYSVTVELESLTALAAAADNITIGSGTRPSFPGASDNFTGGSPGMIGNTDNATIGNFPNFPGSDNVTVNNNFQSMIAAAVSSVELRQGMSATVSVIVQQSVNVLMVPYSAITTENGKSYVQVITDTGATEKREIQTGVTNYSYTEVTSGLSEGEKISLAQTASSSSSSQSNSTFRQGQSFIIPGGNGGSFPQGGQ
jgi:multidrug efflux pump subunit AcrA (membrane-fusion protein)